VPIPSGFTVVPAPCVGGIAVDYVTFLFGPPGPGKRYACYGFSIPGAGGAYALVKEVDLLAGTYLVQTVHTRSTNQDAAVTTTHWRWDGASDPTETDFEIVEARLDGFWSDLSTYRSPIVTGGEHRWYGPRDAPGNWGDALRIVASPLQGTGSPTAIALPQQVACSVTEMTDVRRRWGRFYIPALMAATLNTSITGTFTTAFVTDVADAAATAFIQSNPNWRLVVFGSPLPTSLEVRNIRVDTVPDIQRRRRYEGGTFQERDISNPE